MRLGILCHRNLQKEARHMLSRKEQDQPGAEIPKQWCEKLTQVLNENYRNQTQSTGKTFTAHALTYPNEVYLAVSLIEPAKEDLAPVTLSLSADLDEKSEPTKLLDQLVDSIAIFFDEYFSTSNWNDYNPIWNEFEHKKLNIHYKITRENVALTLEANRLLAQQ